MMRSVKSVCEKCVCLESSSSSSHALFFGLSIRSSLRPSGRRLLTMIRINWLHNIIAVCDRGTHASYIIICVVAWDYPEKMNANQLRWWILKIVIRKASQKRLRILRTLGTAKKHDGWVFIVLRHSSSVWNLCALCGNRAISIWQNVCVPLFKWNICWQSVNVFSVM